MWFWRVGASALGIPVHCAELSPAGKGSHKLLQLCWDEAHPDHRLGHCLEQVSPDVQTTPLQLNPFNIKSCV